MAADSGGPGVAGPGVSAELEHLLDGLMDRFADRVAERLEGRRGRMINQADSELGARRHRDAVKRRMANGEGGAGRAGRDYLLTKEAIREELARKGGRGDKGAPTSPGPRPDDRGPSSANSPAKSRTRELATFEKDLMRGLNSVR